jgi:RNA-binding protein YhbY
MPVKELQLGKNGITDNFIETLKLAFSNTRTLKISVLQSARESKEDVKKQKDELLTKLGNHYTGKVLGFTIILKKWRKARK